MTRAQFGQKPGIIRRDFVFTVTPLNEYARARSRAWPGQTDMHAHFHVKIENLAEPRDAQ